MAKQKPIKPTDVLPITLTPTEQEFKDRYQISDFEARTAVKRINQEAEIENIKTELAVAKAQLLKPTEERVWTYFSNGGRTRLRGNISETDTLNDQKFLVELYEYSKQAGMSIERSNIEVKAGVFAYLVLNSKKWTKTLFKNVYLSNGLEITEFEVISL